MEIKKIFRRYKLTTRSGANLENAIVELMNELQSISNAESETHLFTEQKPFQNYHTKLMNTMMIHLKIWQMKPGIFKTINHDTIHFKTIHHLAFRVDVLQ